MYRAQDGPLPLPYGWVRQTDQKSGHEFYVDTKASPPRSIWTHPYEDEQYLNEHPDIKSKIRGSNNFGSDSSLLRPPPENSRRHSFNGRPATPVQIPPSPHKKGFLEKVKEKAKRSMEEYNEKKRRDIMMMQQQQQRLYGQPQYGGYGTSQYAAPQYAYPQSRYGMGGRRTGMGGMALPMMGGLAGGLLLGDLLDNGGGWGGGGDWTGGGFGGFGGF